MSGLKLSAVSAFVFDCDGVLLDTVSAKLQSFRAWVPEEHASRRDEFNRYNLSAFGRSRRVQIQHFYEGILGMSITPDFLAAEVARFAAINQQIVWAAKWLPGSREFLQGAHARGTPLHVLSGTPEAELRALLEFHGVSSWFASIVGAPTKKVDGLLRIISGVGGDAQSVVFVGDATHDFESSAAVGARFIYKPSAATMVADKSLHVVQSLMEIDYEKR